MNEKEYSVCQFFTENDYEYVRRYVSVREALDAFAHYTNNVAANAGFVQRVIITDGGDCINMEWEYGKGITYPPEAAGKTLRPDWKERMGTS